ncbi:MULTISPECIES: PIG-L family deacetylase [Mumia]|uniref:PIG-L family deacetylase n=1 Tax=Mumia TaxID=1546255 RepID=UPI0014203800|nr:MULTISPECIES: PIG-L family deacetylase [unclassified Mumia]QMW65421.1 response regulator [Mumia sp. ZJ1417]
MDVQKLRALVIEDDPDAANFARIALERFADMEVAIASDAEEALTVLAVDRFDVIVSDIELPGRSGLDILPQVRMLAPGVPVVILTAHGVVSYAVEALRSDADEFLVKPIAPTDLAARATQLAQEAKLVRSRSRSVVLAVGAHPDDVEIGIGATLAAHAAAGDQLVIMTLSGGAIGGEAAVRHEEALAAAAVVGARLVHLDFQDTYLDPADGVITAIEEVVAEVQPDRVYTHSARDRHQDHRAVHEAVQVAARRVPGLWCYQSPSSTVEFRPNRFIDVEGYVETKLRMLAAYASQRHRDYVQPELVRATARYWSRFSPARDVEPLETVRAAELVAAPEVVATAEADSVREHA